MNDTGKVPESAQSAMAANLTDCLSRTRSLLFCELHLHPQLGDRRLVIPGLGPQPDQLGPLGLAQRGIRLPDSAASRATLSRVARGNLTPGLPRIGA